MTSARELNRREWAPAEYVLWACLGLIAVRGLLTDYVDGPAVQTWFTIFISISLQAMPFLVMGVVLSGFVAAYVRPGAIARLLPSDTRAAVPVAGLSGLALPGCECGSVPVAGRLVAHGVAPPAALTFLLAAPAINPIVLISTAVAFPGMPEMVVARFLASLLAAIMVGLIWVRIGRDQWVERALRQKLPEGTRWEVFTSTASHDLLHAGGYLVVGALAAATLQVVVPSSVLDAIGGAGVASIIVMALLAFFLSICSEADAFVAAGLTQFSLTSRLVFLVVGPMVDMKLVAMQTGVFGAAMSRRFAPLTFVVAIGSGVVVGSLLL
ncbi:MAG: permease [Actinomycetia bacterium]|nr:permease [Actinomycetes bacterium]